MAKPLSKLRKKICTEIHNNGGWFMGAAKAQLNMLGVIHFISSGGAVFDTHIQTDIRCSNQLLRNKLTFEQYQQFLAEQEYPQAIEPEEDEPVKPIGLETLLSAWKAANEVVTEQESKLSTAKQVAEEAHKAVQNALSAFGWGKPSVTITDAKDLLPGDRILCVGESWKADNIGQVRIVNGIGNSDAYGKSPIFIDGTDFGFEFEFVERPELA
ncbi:MAG: hypothetical protein ACRDCE_22610 [Cetobacterium sp.]|uniref:hypothetical protein n=1 Tax=Cetobacterium sp. TaxID=2071632 RepID=UPI003EE69146